MTYAAANARGEGTWHYCVVIPGTAYVVGTAEDEPEDDWFVNGSYTYMRGLDAESLRLSCEAHPGEVWPDTGSMDIEIHDPTGTLSSYLVAAESLTSALLASTTTAAATTVKVDTSAVFATPCDGYCGLETWRITAKPSGTTLTVTRGRYGSLARAHHADPGALVPIEPVIATGPGDLRGRRVLVYGAEERAGVVSAYTLLWRGYVSGWVDRRPYWISIPVSHVLKGWLSNDCFGETPTGQLRGIYVPNVPRRRWGRMVMRSTTSANVVVDLVPDGSTVFYPSREAFFSASRGAVSDATGSWTLAEGADECALMHYSGPGMSVVDASPEDSGLAVLLGFEPSYPHGATPKVAALPVVEAFTDLSYFSPTSGHDRRLYLRDGEASAFATTGVRLEDGSDTEYGLIQVVEVNTTDDYLTIESRHPPSWSYGVSWPEEIMIRGGDPAAIVRQTWLMDGEAADVIRALWCGRVYDGAVALGYTLPERWLPCLACEEGDVDWDGLRELTRLCAGGYLSRVQSVVTEAKSIQELVTGWLLACGIYAYVDATGRVAWALAGMPAEGEATLAEPITDAVIDAESARDIRVEYGSEALLNAVKLSVPIGYEDDGDIKTRPLYVVDGASLQRYGRRGPVSLDTLEDEAREIELGVAPTLVESAADFEIAVATHLRATVIGMLSRPRASILLRVSPQARRYTIGDVVRVTTEWAVDPWTGERGITERLGLVLGYTRQLGYGGTDELRIMLAGDGFGAIAPAALATSWNAGTKTLTFASGTRYKRAADATDLDYFEATDKVRFRTYNSASPTWWTALLAAVTPATTNATAVITTDPFGNDFVPCIMAFDTYSEATAGQRAEGWVWLADDADGQVQNLRVGWRWAS